MTRLKVAAVAGVLLFGLLAVMPLVAVAPEAEKDFKDCEKIQKVKVCFIILLTNRRVSVGGTPGPGIGGDQFDVWLYVSNPSENVERFPPIGSGEDNVVVDFTIFTIIDNMGDVSGPHPGLLESLFPDRFDPVVHAFETKRVFFTGGTGFVEAQIGVWVFVYELALTFRGESFTLTIPIRIEIRP